MFKNSFIGGAGVILLPLFIVVLIFSPTVHAKETIKWLWYEQVPYFLGEGPGISQGLGDQLTLLYQQNLPEYEHINIKVNVERYNILIQEEGMCVPVAWLSHNERKFMVHTRPFTLEPPAGIYIHKSMQNEFGDPGSILSLKHLLEKTSFRLGVLSGMEYSTEVDKLIKQYRGHKNLLNIEAPMVQINLQMLKLKRLDYLLGLPSQHTELKNDSIAAEYLFYNIKEIDNFIPMYSHCSNTRTGNNIVKKLNTLLTREYLTKSFDSYDYWYGENELFRVLFFDYIIRGISHSIITDM